jgi:hypothetical protein
MFNIHVTEFDNDLGKNKAREALEVLLEAYPRYSWKVDVKGGVCFVRMLDDRLKGNWGINLKMKDLDHDAAVFKRKVKFAAGEFLERCNLRRGMNTGEEVKVFEGIPDKWQPT